MLKKKFVFCVSIALIFACLFNFSACNSTEKDNVVFAPDSIYYDGVRICGTDLDFCINYVYSGNQPTFEIKAMDGDNLNFTSIACSDATSDFEKDVSVDGYKLGCLYIDLEYGSALEGKKVVINSIDFSVDGTEKKLTFEKPIKIYLESPDANTGILDLEMVASTTSIGSDGYSIVYTCQDNITLNSISLGDYLNLEDATISLIDKNSPENETVIGTLSSLPCELSKGDTFSISGTVVSPCETSYQNFYSTTQLDYSCNGITYSEYFKLYVDSLYETQESVEAAIGNILKYKE